MRSVQYLNTKLGLTLIQNKLMHLIAQLPKASSDIEKARSMGDLSENFEYHAAKKILANLQKEINELTKYMENAISHTLSSTTPESVCFGSKVTFKKLNSNDVECTYIILGDHESEISKHKAINSISLYSPIIQAMLHKPVNSMFKFRNDVYKITQLDAVSENELYEAINQDLLLYDKSKISKLSSELPFTI